MFSWSRVSTETRPDGQPDRLLPCEWIKTIRLMALKEKGKSIVKRCLHKTSLIIYLSISYRIYCFIVFNKGFQPDKSLINWFRGAGLQTCQDCRPWEGNSFSCSLIFRLRTAKGEPKLRGNRLHRTITHIVKKERRSVGSARS